MGGGSDSDDDDDTPYVIAPAPPVVNTPPTSPHAPPLESGARRRAPPPPDAASGARTRQQQHRAGRLLPGALGPRFPPPAPPPAVAALPPPAAALSPLAPADGPNTNDSNSRFHPITVQTDKLELTGIVRKGAIDANTGEQLYVGKYPPSYNMTPEAYTERTTNIKGGRNFQSHSTQPSIYDPTGQNVDVVWRPLGEPAAIFPLQMLADFMDQPALDTRAERLAARSAPPPPAAPVETAPAAALYCTCSNHSAIPSRVVPSVDFVPVSSQSQPSASAYFSSPMC